MNTITVEGVETPKEPVKMTSVRGQPITLLQDSVLVEMEPGFNKRISYQDFLSMISKSIGKQAETVNPPENFILPKGCYNFRISKDTLQLNCYYEGGKRPFKYQGRSNIKEVMVPNIVIGFTLAKSSDEWLVSDARYFATNLPINKLPQEFRNRISASDGMYNLPFTNVYNDAKMCYGGNSMPTRIVKGDLRRLNYYYDFLWVSPFNDDLSASNKINASLSNEAWYKKLEGWAKSNTPFDYSFLTNYHPNAGGMATPEPTVRPASTQEGPVHVEQVDWEDETDDDETDDDEGEDDNE